MLKLFWRERKDPLPFHKELAARAMQDLGSIRGQTVVDLGCGPGHYTRALEAAGATVVPIDLDAAEFGLPGGPPRNPVVASGEAIPLPDQSANGLMCSNMLEHTPNPAAVISEMARVVQSGGWIWLSFTNWYSPWGGHDMSPWHYLGPRLGLKAYRALTRKVPKNQPGQSLFVLHIGQVLKLVELDPRFSVRRVVPRYYPRLSWLLRIPGLREVLTWNCLLVIDRV